MYHVSDMWANLRYRRAILATVSAFAFAIFLLLNSSFSISRSRLPSWSVPSLSITTEEDVKSSNTSGQPFWHQFYSALISGTPRCALPHGHIEAGIGHFYPSSGATHRQSLINLNDADIEELTTAHSWFVSQITASDYPKPAFTPGSSGIVTTAGGEFLPEALVAIRMLRYRGSNLPVDVFFADESEEEPEICETVLKDLGATCHTLSRIIDAVGLPRRQEITRYQLKAFALIFSQYDNIAWIDADQFPLVDPLTLFNAEPFTSKGLITWPDYWFSTTSPLFFRIAGIPDDRIPATGLRAASETGQLLISKSKHLQTLELVAYYNFHGPSHYYKLLSQGAVGEGDKETFLAAALALDAPFWAVETPIDTIGWHSGNGFKPTGMLQASPIEDYELAQQGADRKAAPAFLHSEQHKPNAVRFAHLWRDDINQRMWMPKADVLEKFHGDDLERVMWYYIVWTACGKELNGHVFRDWKEKLENAKSEEICAYAKGIYDELFKEELEHEGKKGWVEGEM